MRKRNNRIHIYLTDAELETLTQKQRLAGLPREAFCRKVLNDAEVKQGPSLEIAMLLKELNKIGVNINQIAAKANAIGFIDVTDLKVELERLDSIEQLIIDAFAVGD